MSLNKNLYSQIEYGIEKICNIHKSLTENLSNNEGISSLQIRILNYISKNNIHSISDISKEFEISKVTASKSLKNLLEKGFVVREKNKLDRRKYNLKLTKKGRKIRRKLIQKKKFLQKALQNLDSEKRELFLKTIKFILINCVENKISKRITICINCKNFKKINNSIYICNLNPEKRLKIEEMLINCKNFK